ncbi:hypothetical protein CC2G_000264 [Coprinopsis cinerea AmutBmut pab1-1]|nr:hypothetical protein CC2G_000264 [Coprinopsis cinerea AmutBmut pab1-1]
MSPAPRAPTSSLPPLGRLHSYTGNQVRSGLDNLRSLYFPRSTSKVTTSTSSPPTVASRHSKLGTPLGCNTPIIDSGYASAEETDDETGAPKARNRKGVVKSAPRCCDLLCVVEDLEAECKTVEVLRADPFENGFAIRWLTGFISRAEEWAGEVEEGEEGKLRGELVEEALDLLSAFTTVEEGEEEEEHFTRILKFERAPSEEGETLTVELNDSMKDDDHTSVGLQTWGSAIIFSERMCISPSAYLSSPSRAENSSKPMRILELGAGTGILSIVAAKLLGGSQPAPEIIATDYHPEVLENLEKNIATNFKCGLDEVQAGKAPVQVRALDWENPDYSPPFDERFDLILAADVVYHPEHARWIKNCVEGLLALPRSGELDGGVFWMFIAVRPTGRHEGLDKTVDDLFGDHQEPSLRSEDGGWRLGILEREAVARVAGNVGRVDEHSYRLFKIGWVR